jgi:hypothetical protein
LQAEVFDMNTLYGGQGGVLSEGVVGDAHECFAKLMDVFLASEKEFKSDNPKYIVFKCRLSGEEDPIKVGVPFRALGEQLQEQMIRADLYRDLPRGRKRRGWKKEFLESLSEAAKEMGEVSDEEILQTVRAYRKERRAPEITVAAES